MVADGISGLIHLEGETVEVLSVEALLSLPMSPRLKAKIAMLGTVLAQMKKDDDK